MTMTIPLAGFNRSGGVQTLARLANAMADRGWRVRIVVPDYGGEPPVALAPAVELRRVATQGWPAPLRMGAFYLALALTAARDTDVCVANFYLTAYCACLSRLLHRRAHAVYFLQGDEAESHGRLADAPRVSRWLRYALARGSYRLPLPMLCVSAWLRQQVGRADAVVVGQGIDLAFFQPPQTRPARGRVVVGTIGSAAPVKGYPDVAAALAQLPGKAIDVRLVGADDVMIPAGIDGLRLAASTEQEMARFYRDCDVFVFASYREGFGLPPLEAMACGCAVVTTDCGGVRDYARDGENCLVVPAGDPPALAAAIRRLVDEPSLRSRLSGEGVRTAVDWPRERMVQRFADGVTREAA
jgi:glycosyltransferase involved in cell wall biosynthesis